jgi:SAM-dependent methyltransferase
MREFWDRKARENAMWYIHSTLDFSDPDQEEFWRSGEDNLERTLQPFDVRLTGTEAVLDIGCGIGRITRALSGRAASVVGIDVSAEMIERGRQALADLDNVELVVGTGRDLSPLGDGAFDVVYSFIVFQHIPDPAVTCAYVREIGRVLRPGGWTVFQVSDRPEVHRKDHWQAERGPARRLRQLFRRGPRDTLEPQWLGSAVPRADLLQALADGGLTLQRSVGDGSQFCVVHAAKPGAAS